MIKGLFKQYRFVLRSSIPIETSLSEQFFLAIWLYAALQATPRESKNLEFDRNISSFGYYLALTHLDAIGLELYGTVHAMYELILFLPSFYSFPIDV